MSSETMDYMIEDGGIHCKGEASDVNGDLDKVLLSLKLSFFLLFGDTYIVYV